MVFKSCISVVLMTALALHGAAKEQLTLADCVSHKLVVGVRIERDYAAFVTQVPILGAKTFAGVACIVEGHKAAFVQEVADVYKTLLVRNAVSITDDLKKLSEELLNDACTHVFTEQRMNCKSKLRRNTRVQAIWFAEFKQKGVVHEFGDPTIKPADAVPMRGFIWPVAVENQLKTGQQEGLYTAPMLRFYAGPMACLLKRSS